MPDAQRPETAGIPGGKQFCRRHHNQGIGSVNPIHDTFQCLLDRAAFQTLLCEQIRDHLCVTCRVKNTALLFQFFSQQCGIDQIAVVTDSHVSFPVADHDRLSITAPGISAGGIADMPDCDVPFSQSVQFIFCKYFAHKPHILVMAEHAPVAQCNTRRFLSTVLQRK